MMHPMFDYLDYKKAAIAALQDYGNQAIILEHADDLVTHTRQAMMTIPAPSYSGMPSAHNPRAVENKLVGQLSRLDELSDRKARAQSYMDWFNPMWEQLTDEDKFVLEAFFLDGLTSEDAAMRVAEQFYVERKTAFQKKQRAITRLAKLLYARPAD
ncbi:MULTISPECIES: hypothetical protein [unclassified Corynebacterium]|uniref:hypothetical protein n=1 Tax=unclassified Corynebacterium TaxID=2624378 RepID=UPI00211CE402|nr:MULTISPECIES: hypothetical protein [unclassified Corynebacterium]MCQ9359252.1 hypothetical protein [Corynebacterium sp. 142RC1]MCQ9365393.1 hypothetical protein [Corynebacterium sp. 70RC1]